MAREEIDIIVLRRVRYNDRHCVVTAFSRQRGTVAMLVPDGAGRAGVRNRALLMPGCEAFCMADVKPGRDLLRVSGVGVRTAPTSLHSHPLKGMIAMFLAEVLSALLRDSGPDPLVYDFISRSMAWLDVATDAVAVANFPLVFLYRLAAMLGVEPDVSTWRRGRMLCVADGVFHDTPTAAGRMLTPRQSRVAVTLSQLDYAHASRLKMKRAERADALDVMLEFLAVHRAPLSSLRSLDVFRGML